MYPGDPNKFMHLPPSFQYLCICSIKSELEYFYAAADAVSIDFGIQINIQSIAYEACLDLVKNERDRNFCILIRSDNGAFRKHCLIEFNALFAKSNCRHKLALIVEKPEEVHREIYFTLLGSLNLACVFSRDGIIKTYGIQMSDNSSDFKSSLITMNPGPPIPIEICNIQPIFLDMSRCGVLEPLLYIVARDFGTCIAKILLPDSTIWKLAYLIQCDDSGRNDLDMFKVCLVEEEPVPEAEESKNDVRELNVLADPKYSLCRDLTIMIHDLHHLPPSVDVITPLLNIISEAMDFAKMDDFTIFPDAANLIQLKRKYARLFTEVSDILVKLPNRGQQNRLQGHIKTMRRLINVLNVAAKAIKSETPVMVAKPPQWITDVGFYSSPQARFSIEGVKARNNRLNSEQKDGIVSTPLLEPYLEVKWPRTLPTKPEKYQHSVFQVYAQKLIDQEMDLQLNKRFGI